MRQSPILERMARRVSRRAAQCAVTAAAAILIISIIGSGIARQSFEKIADKEVVLREIGAKPFVNSSHFTERSFFQNLTAGSFFGVTIGPAAGVVIFLLCVLIEALPCRKFRIGCAAAAVLLLTYLSHHVLRIGSAVPSFSVWLLPVLTAAVCELVSPTPLWGHRHASSESFSPDTLRLNRFAFVLFAAFNVCILVALALWARQSAPILRAASGGDQFFLHFRDDILRGTSAGRALDRFYYHNSPYASEYISPTQFQPVCVLTCGLDNSAVKSIPRSYGRRLIPIYTVSVSDFDTAAARFASGVFDVMVVQPSTLGMTPEQIEEALAARGDLPHNWRTRCIIITNRRRPEKPVWTTKSRTAVQVRRSIDGMTETNHSAALRDLIYFCFIRPLQSTFGRPLFTTVLLAAAVWISLCVTAWSARHRGWAAVPLVVSAVLAVSLWWILLAGSRDRTALAEAMGHLNRPSSSPTSEELRQMLSSELAVTRYAALRYLADKPDPAYVEDALGLFDDPDPRVRMWAVDLAGTIYEKWKPDGRARQRIIGALDDESFHVRYKAAEAAANAGVKEAKPHLLNLIQENKHLYVTWYAINSLRKINQ